MAVTVNFLPGNLRGPEIKLGCRNQAERRIKGWRETKCRQRTGNMDQTWKTHKDWKYNQRLPDKENGDLSWCDLD